MTRNSRLLLYASSLGLLIDTGCASAEHDEPVEGAAPLALGTEVVAPFGRREKKTKGIVKELYGNLAQVRFRSGDIAWVHVSQMDPPGLPRDRSEDDSCSFEEGDKVMARFSNKRMRYEATVTGVYGKLASVAFDDGDRGWAVCSEMKARKVRERRQRDQIATSKPRGNSVLKCMSVCNKSCRGASNKAKCVSQCRRGCERR